MTVRFRMKALTPEGAFECLKRADSGRTGVASGWTEAGAKAVIQFRARCTPHRPDRNFSLRGVRPRRACAGTDFLPGNVRQAQGLAPHRNRL